MRTFILPLAVCLSLVGCGGGGSSGAPSGSAAAKTAPSNKPADSAKPAAGGDSAKPAESAAAPAADVSPEMAAFLKELDGTDDGVKKALKKVAKPGLDDKDMEMYTLKDAKVIKTDKKSDKQTCYDFEAKAGMMVYTYGVCWEGGKIVSVEDKGSK
jgi:hypothetical protein